MKHCIRCSGHLTLFALLNFIAYTTSIKENSFQLQSKGKEYHNFEIEHGSHQLGSRSESARYRKQATMFDLMNDGLNRRKRQTELMDLEDTKDTELGENPEEEGFWTRIARVALNILKRFMTWLNE